MYTDFELIYLDQLRVAGRMRLADLGLGWKVLAAGGSLLKPFLLPAEEVVAAQWLRGARGWELRVQTQHQGVLLFDGFGQDDFQLLKLEIQRLFSVTTEHREHSVRGWNWGKTDLAKHELVFSVNNKPDFEIPYLLISNSNLTGKNEVAVELNLHNDRLKAGDELVEVRFFIPGTVDGASSNEPKPTEGEEGEEAPATDDTPLASYFYEQLKDRADIGQVAGDAIVLFLDILLLTPRGRYDIDMYPTLLRLRGKTYDYKIQYRQVERIFSLPKPDNQNHLLVVQVDPPLRQGQTRYPFLVLQFSAYEELEVLLNVDDAEFDAKYLGRLHKLYDQATHLVVLHCFQGLSERPVVGPLDYISKHQQPGVLCSLKALEGYLYPLEKCFLFVTKPTVYIPFKEVLHVSLLRLGGGAGTGSKTFDLEVVLRGSGGLHVFGSIDREEADPLERFCANKGLRVRNDEKETQQRLTDALNAELDADMEEPEDSEEDGDFKSGDDLDPAEEFDLDADSDAAMSDGLGSDDGSGLGGDDEPATKKAKHS